MRPSDPGRRGVLATAALALPLLVSGCTGLSVLGTPPRPAPDVAVLKGAIARERLMIARYQSVLHGLPSLQASLGDLLAEHQAHLAALRARLVDPRPGASPAPRATTGPTPATPAAALAYLRESERSAAAGLLANLDAAPGSLAQLLASIAASELTHAAVLGSPGRRR